MATKNKTPYQDASKANKTARQDLSRAAKKATISFKDARTYKKKWTGYDDEFAKSLEKGYNALGSSSNERAGKAFNRALESEFAKRHAEKKTPSYKAKKKGK